LGDTFDTVGTPTYVKSSSALVALVPPVVVTDTFQVPAAAPPPVTAMISVAETTWTPVAAMAPALLPWLIATEAPGRNPVPVIVMEVPPVVGPEPGLTVETVGATAAELLA
jgi:hypothetical protein